MAAYRRRRWPAIVAGYGVFCLALGALTSLIYENTASVNQALVIRMAVASGVAVMLIHLRRHSRGDPLWDPPSEFDRAASAEPPAAKLHPDFARLRDEVETATGSRSSFRRGLWPRLIGLARARGVAIEPASLPKRRGRSAQQLSDLIARIERNK